MIDAVSPATRLVLAIDTSTDAVACALGLVEQSAPRTLASCLSADCICRRRANVELVGIVDKALEEFGAARRDVSAIVVGTGPGSFTGVRIGVNAAKGFAEGLGIGLVGVSTLDAVAWSAWKSGIRGRLGVVMDAMRKEVYPGFYELTEAGAERLFPAETVAKAQACAQEWSLLDEKASTVLVGDGLFKYADLFRDAGYTEFGDEGLWRPTGEGLLLAALSERSLDDDAPCDPVGVLPLYTRLSDAEENERARLGLKNEPSLLLCGVDDALSGIHIQLRPAGINDARAVSQLEAEAFGADAGHAAWNEQMFADEFERPGAVWWLAHDQGTPIGFAGGIVAGGNLDIMDVAVAPMRRREGIAARLVERVAYDAQMLGARTATLEVASDNEPAKSLYESLGFVRAGVRKRYYGHDKDALTMCVDLPLHSRETQVEDQSQQASSRQWPPSRPSRDASARDAIDNAAPLILAIESSCDETAAAVISFDGTVLSNVVATQIDFHARFGGVVPEIASRKHTEAIAGVYEEAMAQAGSALGVGTLYPEDLSAVACTQGPGLVGALVVGLSFSKALAWSADVPLVCVNHLEGHLFANLFETPDLEPPFVASLLSGGHTMLVHVRDWGDYEVLGQTLDDAVGEAFDKVAKALGLGYPGGPVISRLAARGNPRAIDFPRAMMHSHDYRFSLSGLKTAVVTYIHDENAAGRAIDLPDLAASFQAAVVDVQVRKAVDAVKEFGVHDFCAGGGVSANPALREAYTRALGRRGVRVTVPPLSACTDNAAMIALVALHKFKLGQTSPLTADAEPNLPLPSSTPSTVRP